MKMCYNNIMNVTNMLQIFRISNNNMKKIRQKGMVIFMNFKKLAMLSMLALLFIGFAKNGAVATAQESDTVSSVTQSAISANAKASDKNIKKTVKKNKKAGRSYTSAELRLMASIINCEAGSESYQGKLAVGIVIMNRIDSKSFPNTLKGVIFQKGQFSPVRNGSLRKRLSQYDAGKTNNRQWKACISAARKVLDGQTTISYKGRKKSLKGYHFFSVYLSGARFRLGGHRFK